jgi:CBS domain-containing protein
VTDLDLIAAAYAGSDGTAGELASRRQYVTPSDHIGRVAGLLRQDRLHHLIVLDDRGAHPVGIISTLDVADVLAELPRLESDVRAGSGGTEAHDGVDAAGLGRQ